MFPRGACSPAVLQGDGCLTRVGGMTGETMGANTEGCEVWVSVVRRGLGEGER